MKYFAAWITVWVMRILMLGIIMVLAAANVMLVWDVMVADPAMFWQNVGMAAGGVVGIIAIFILYNIADDYRVGRRTPRPRD